MSTPNTNNRYSGTRLGFYYLGSTCVVDKSSLSSYVPKVKSGIDIKLLGTSGSDDKKK